MKINILTAVLLLSLTAASAQSLDKDMCRDMALENNKKLLLASLEKQRTEFDLKAYRSNYFPSISATGNYLVTTGTTGMTLQGGYLPTFITAPDGTLVPNIEMSSIGQPIIGPDGNPVFKQYALMPDTEINFDLNNAYTVGITLAQPIYMGGKINAANSAAKLANEIAKENIRKTTDEIILESDKAYWQYVKASEMVVVATKYQYVVEELVRNIKNTSDVGITPNSVLLKAQTKLNEVKLITRKANNAHRLARMNLCYVIGLELNSKIELKELLTDDIIKPTYMGVDVSSRAELEILSKQVEVLGQQVRIARSEFLPNIGIVGGYSYIGGIKVNDDALTTNGAFSAMLSVSIPIFSWGEGRNKVRSTQVKQEVARLQKEEFQQLMELEANKSYNEFEEAYYRVELTNLSLISATENMRISKDNYEVGMENLTDYLQAQTMWQQTWADYIDAKAMFQLAHTYYLKSIGKLT